VSAVTSQGAGLIGIRSGIFQKMICRQKQVTQYSTNQDKQVIGHIAEVAAIDHERASSGDMYQRNDFSKVLY